MSSLQAGFKPLHVQFAGRATAQPPRSRHHAQPLRVATWWHRSRATGRPQVRAPAWWQVGGGAGNYGTSNPAEGGRGPGMMLAPVVPASEPNPTRARTTPTSRHSASWRRSERPNARATRATPQDAFPHGLSDGGVAVRVLGAHAQQAELTRRTVRIRRTGQGTDWEYRTGRINGAARDLRRSVRRGRGSRPWRRRRRRTRCSRRSSASTRR